MTGKNRNLLKYGWIAVLCVGIFSFSTIRANAIPLYGTTISYSGSAKLKVDNKDVYWATDYTLNYKLEESGPEFHEKAFCVENVEAVLSGAEYELIPATSVNHTAKILASNYFYNHSWNYTQAVIQLAIWEATFETGSLLNAGDGYFQILNSTLASQVNDILKNISSYGIVGPLALAHSPAGTPVGSIAKSQDYLVGVSVPDASIMFLLGPAIFGIGIMGRKTKKN
jgi:hypothetical protein